MTVTLLAAKPACSAAYFTSEIRSRGEGGFSLVELMIVIALIAILTSIGVPSFRETLAQTKVTGTANLFIGSLDTIRSEAVGRNRAVGMCRSLDPNAAAPVCSSAAVAGVPANDWGMGWILFSKPNNSATVTPFDSTTDTLLQRVLPGDSGNAAERAVVSFNPGIALIGISPQGTRIDGGAGQPMVTIDFRKPAAAMNQSRARCITVNLLGRTEVTRPTGSSC
jgi:prepilin-type N-terminal cleavage/methylation domain-containing protein